jgi:hypothetical protein
LPGNRLAAAVKDLPPTHGHMVLPDTCAFYTVSLDNPVHNVYLLIELETPAWFPVV